MAPPEVRRYTGASDAAYENQVGTGGFLVVLFNEGAMDQRVGRVVTIEPELYNMWHPCETYIAQLELLMVGTF